ncbi:MAG: restriction endonuclease subunit S [Methylobacter sp.]|jgi:type I restriction enzyme S subunit
MKEERVDKAGQGGLGKMHQLFGGRMDATYPQSWSVQPLGDVMDIQGGSQPPKSEFIYQPHEDYIQLLQIRDFGEKPVPTYVKKNRVTKFCTKDDVLIARYGASLGRILTGLEGAYNVALAKTIFDKRLFFSKYIFYLLQTSVLQLPLKMISRSAQNGFAKHEIAHARLPIPPLNEQHRIVSKIEELFSELDSGLENLKTAREQLKVYRQALLKHAFEGKLTAQWRAENQGKLETAEALLKRIQQERVQRYQQQLADWEAAGKQGSKPKAPKPLPPLTAEELAELPELPKGWAWVRLLEACEAVVDCHNKTAPYQATGIPLVRTPSIRDMKLNFDDAIRYVSQETYEYWSRRCPPLPGDILFTREAPMGEAALIPEGKMLCMGQRIMLLRPGKFLSGEYLLSATQNPIFKKVADKVAVGTGVKHLRVGDVERLVFPLCSVSEQNEIANQLDALISETDQLDQTIVTSLQQAEALRQSILKKAFSGQLVPHDPHDEPASKLLERIKAEKSAQPNTKKVRT